ncbi:MAG: dienelactone hydrolase family protein [Betaproteobacteria bacterium]|jgi:putative phosphoribosyl transferase|nr:MAG: dienelactone hydrolase family protein [Betaproteobacteria bacterium]
MNGIEQIVSIPAGPVSLEGALHAPKGAGGIVIFSHGSGSGRLSPRNQFVAAELRKLGLGTLLLDLLTEEEDVDYELRFDISLLTQRLGYAVRFIRDNADTSTAPIGLFGASTGAASALRVAASMSTDVSAVVSRGGRPDLTGADALSKVRSPTLLIVGGNDFGVIELNESAREGLVECQCELVIVPGATHLFEERGKLEEVARLAGDWFSRHLMSANTSQE